jgi:hypothetical protein
MPLSDEQRKEVGEALVEAMTNYRLNPWKGCYFHTHLDGLCVDGDVDMPAELAEAVDQEVKSRAASRD